MVTDYDELIPRMTNQTKDRHVLAAAVASDADRIVTFNRRDFPTGACEPYGVEAEHPDDVLDYLTRAGAPRFAAAVRQVAQ